MDVRVFAEVNLRHIVLEHVADDPHVGHVGDRERIRRGESLHARGVGNLLVRDYPGNRSVHFDDSGGMVRIRSEKVEMLLRRIENDLGVILGILRDFLSALGNRPMLEQDVGAVELDLRQLLVLDGLAVIRKRAGDVRASHFEQKLPFLDGVAEPRVDLHHPPRSQRGYRHLTRNIRTNYAGHIQLGYRDRSRRLWPGESVPDGPL